MGRCMWGCGLSSVHCRPNVAVDADGALQHHLSLFGGVRWAFSHVMLLKGGGGGLVSWCMPKHGTPWPSMRFGAGHISTSTAASQPLTVLQFCDAVQVRDTYYLVVWDETPHEHP